jgi:hypothetical protein
LERDRGFVLKSVNRENLNQLLHNSRSNGILIVKNIWLIEVGNIGENEIVKKRRYSHGYNVGLESEFKKIKVELTEDKEGNDHNNIEVLA